jgi:hypothetical protein
MRRIAGKVDEGRLGGLTNKEWSTVRLPSVLCERTRRIEVQRKPPDNMRISFADGACEELDVTVITSSVVRLRETPLTTSENLRLGDEIEVAAESDGVRAFLCLRKSAEHETRELFLPRSLADSTALRDVLAEVSALGVQWEQAFGGVIFLHGTSESIADAVALIDGISGRSYR